MWNYFCVKYLIKNNLVDINATDRGNQTALLHAISTEQESKNWSKCVEYLVKREQMLMLETLMETPLSF